MEEVQPSAQPLRRTGEHAGASVPVHLHARRTEADKLHARVGELAVVRAARLVGGAQVLHRCSGTATGQRGSTPSSVTRPSYM